MQEKRPVSILITAGGTQEDIDTVRSITNHATGRLGSLIADAFLQDGAKVTYLCGETSVLPALHGCDVIKIRGVTMLIEKLDMLLQENVYDCVIHSMAVSDFTPCAVTTADEMAQAIERELCGGDFSKEEMSARIRDIIINGSRQLKENKISSKSDYLIMTLKQTPKVIRHIKAIQPQTLLVGFKLLSGVSETELLERALDLSARNGCDYVLANDLNDIYGDTHKAFLTDKSKIICRAGTKTEIAQIIFQNVMERINETR